MEPYTLQPLVLIDSVEKVGEGRVSRGVGKEPRGSGSQGASGTSVEMMRGPQVFSAVKGNHGL